MELKFKFKSFLVRFAADFIYRPQILVTGTTSVCADQEVCIYLDYDKMDQDAVERELVHFQTAFDIGDFLLFCSSEHNFHAVSFSKMKMREFITLLENSNVDIAFARVPRFFSLRSFVLRNFEKGTGKDRPQLLKTLKHSTHRKQSLAHYNYFKALYPGIKKNKLINSDGLEELDVITYKTGSKIIW